MSSSNPRPPPFAPRAVRLREPPTGAPPAKRARADAPLPAASPAEPPPPPAARLEGDATRQDAQPREETFYNPRRRNPKTRIALPSQGSDAPRKKPAFPHGNYDSYYAHRDPHRTDPRLDAWDAAWFAGRTVLDVGCNAGLVAVEVAARFAPRAVLGVDIDPGLVRKAGGVLAARYSLTKPAIAWDAGKGCIVKLEGTADGAPYFPLSAIAAHGTVPIIRPEKVPVIGADGEEERLEGFPWNVEFAVGDWTKAPARKVEAGERKLTGDEEGSWDVVLALAITKWIHLNGGDAGLRKFLAKLAAVLAPGGRLIIEAQPWASYLKRTKEWDLSKLEMRPEGTRGELEGLGLAWERTVSAPAADDEAEAGGKARKTAFSDREMMVFVKP